MKLFAVYLGGRAPKCNLELHDVVFAIGEKIESTYEQLMDKWFGTPKGLHLDSWMELDVVDGHRVSVTKQKPDNGLKLYFINVGTYQDGRFSEVHANKLVVATNKEDAKRRGKDALLIGWPCPVHTDDLYDVDDCIEVSDVDGFYVSLEKTDAPENLKTVNGYNLVPKGVVQDYLDRKAKVAS